MKKSISVILTIAIVLSSVFTASMPIFATEATENTGYRVVNNYDESNVTYINGGNFDTSTTDYVDGYTIREVNGVQQTVSESNTQIHKVTRDTAETYAAHLGRTKNQEDCKVIADQYTRTPNILRIYDSNTENPQYFIPEPYTTYTISFDYMAAAVSDDTDKYAKFRLMFANDAEGNDFSYDGDGTEDGIKTKNNVIDTLARIDCNTQLNVWNNTGTLTFTTGKYVAPLYITVVTSPTWWFYVEAWIDNIVINKLYTSDPSYRSSNSLMTFDESNVTYKNSQSTFETATLDNSPNVYTERTVNGSITEKIAESNTLIQKAVDSNGGETYAAHFGMTINGKSTVSYDNGARPRHPNILKLYDSNTENLQYFIPEPNTKYTISFDYMAVTVDKEDTKFWEFRLMYANDVEGKSFDYDGDGTTDGVKTKNNVIDSMLNVTNSTTLNTWTNTGEISFTTGDYVAPLYIAVVTNPDWWFNAEVWVDNIEINKLVSIDPNYRSTNSSMTYDEEGVAYKNSQETFITSPVDNSVNVYTERTVNGITEKIAESNTLIQRAVDSNGKATYAAHFGMTLNPEDTISYDNGARLRQPNILKLYDSNTEYLQYFIPEANTTYTISFDYMATSLGSDTDKWWKFRLMYANDVLGSDFSYNGDGTTDAFKTKNNVIDEIITVKADTPKNEWLNTGTLSFTTGDYVAPLYITVVTTPAWWYDAEVWVDNIEITKLYTLDNNYQSTNSSMTFDEEDVEYENYGTYSSTSVEEAEGCYTVRTVKGTTETTPITQYATNIDMIWDYDGYDTYAAHFGYTKNQEDSKLISSDNHQRFPNILKLYDTEHPYLKYFVPAPYTTYTISFDYMVDYLSTGGDKSLKFRLMYANDAEGKDFSYDGDGTEDGYKTKNNVVDSLAIINDETPLEEWLNTGTLTFTTGEYVAPLYITMVTSPTWWAQGSVWIDNINIEMVVEGVSNCFDEENVSYNTTGTVSATVAGNAKTDRTVNGVTEDTAISFGGVAIEETADKNGANTYAAHFGYAENAEGNKAGRQPNTLKIYDSEAEDLGYFVPKANSSYVISFDYKVAAALNKDIVFKLIYANGNDFVYDNDGTDGAYKFNNVLLNRIVTLKAGTTASDEWYSTGNMVFTTDDSVAPMYIAMLTSGDTAGNADIWVDNISIKRIYATDYINQEDYLLDTITENDFSENEIGTLPEGFDNTYAYSFVNNADKNEALNSGAVAVAEDTNGKYLKISGSGGNGGHILRLPAIENENYKFSVVISNNSADSSAKIGLAIDLGEKETADSAGIFEIKPYDVTTSVYTLTGTDYVGTKVYGFGLTDYSTQLVDEFSGKGVIENGDKFVISVYHIDGRSYFFVNDIYAGTAYDVEGEENKYVGIYTENADVNLYSYKIENIYKVDDIFSLVYPDGIIADKDYENTVISGIDTLMLPELSADNYIFNAKIKLIADGDYGLVTNNGEVRLSAYGKAAAGDTVKLQVYHFGGKSYFFVNGVYTETANDVNNSLIAGLYSNGAEYSVEKVTAYSASYRNLTEAATTKTAVRFANADGKALSGGIKVIANVDKAMLADSENAEYGLAIAKKSDLGKYPLTAFTENAGVVIANSTEENDGVVTYSDILMNLSREDLDSPYIVRSFVKLANGTYYYGDSNEVNASVLVNRYYNKSVPTEAQKELMVALLKDSNYFYGSNEATRFTLFADLHYKEGMYLAQVADVQTIMAAADANNSDFVLQLGDFCNDFIGSPELTNAYLNNAQGLKVYGVYGNHELESEGNSMQVVTPMLTNDNEVVWGTEDGKIGDGSIGYYWYKSGAYRIICTDNNYSYNPKLQIWEHNYTNSYGSPAGNSNSASLGPEQLAWLENILTESANEGISCIVTGHVSYNTAFASDSPDGQAVEAIYEKVNNINPGTVVMSLNGHYHSDHIQLRQIGASNVLYLNMNTVRNGLWKGDATSHYADNGTTFNYVKYDEEGNVVSVDPNALVSELSMGANTHFFEDPLYTHITISKDGNIEVETVKTDWYGGVKPSDELIASIDSNIKTQVTGGICNYLEIGNQITPNDSESDSFSP